MYDWRNKANFHNKKKEGLNFLFVTFLIASIDADVFFRVVLLLFLFRCLTFFISNVNRKIIALFAIAIYVKLLMEKSLELHFAKK